MQIVSLMIIVRVVKVKLIRLKSSLLSVAKDGQYGDAPILGNSVVDS